MNPGFLALLISLFLLSNPVSSWHFLLIEGKTRCVYEELPKKESIMLHLRLLDQLASDPQGGVIVQIKETATQAIEQTKIVPFNDTVKMSFLSEKGGSYEICTTTTTSGHWVSENQKVRFEMRVVYEVDPAFNQKDFEDIAKSEDMDEMYKTLRKLYGKSKHLVDTQENNREKELTLFEENDAINQKIMLCTLFQIIVIVISGVFQIFSLRAFLIKRDLY